MLFYTITSKTSFKVVIANFIKHYHTQHPASNLTGSKTKQTSLLDMIKPSSSKRKADFDDERGERASKVLVVEIESTGDQNGQKRDMIDMVEEEEWIDEEVNSAATLNLNNCIIHEAHLHEEKSTKNRSKSRLFKLSNQYDVKQSSITDHFTRLAAEDKQKSVGNIPSYDVLAEDDKNKKRNKFIEMLLEICEKQQKGSKMQYPETIKRLSMCIYLTGGRLNYNTYMSLLPLPSKSTIYQYYSKQMADVPEGVLRTKELVTYIEENNLSPYVFLSEDATAITGRIECDKKTNRIFGIVHEDDPITGMPVVRGTEVHGGLDIKKLLSSGKQATDVNVILCTSLSPNASPFCLLAYAMGKTMKSENYVLRNRYIAKELQNSGLVVLGCSADGAAPNSGGMKVISGLGGKPDDRIPKEFVEFFAGPAHEPPYVYQDHVHTGGKLKNRLLDIGKVLRLGNSIAMVGHLHVLVKNVPITEHGLSIGEIKLEDRMNYKIVEKLIQPRVAHALKEHVLQSEGTVLG